MNDTIKDYFIPLEVDSRMIRDFEIDRKTVKWRMVGNRRVRVVMIPVTEDVYREYMRTTWREQKQEIRAKSLCLYKDWENVCDHDCEHCTQPVFLESSINFMEDDERLSVNLEDSCIEKIMLEQLAEAMEDLTPAERDLLERIKAGESERTIAKALGYKSKMSIRKKKEKLFALLRKKIGNVVTISPDSVRPLVKGGTSDAKERNRSLADGNQPDCPKCRKEDFAERN